MNIIDSTVNNPKTGNPWIYFLNIQDENVTGNISETIHNGKKVTRFTFSDPHISVEVLVRNGRLSISTRALTPEE